MPKVRRIVTGHNEDGKSVVVSDGVCTNVFGPSAELWLTDQTPATVHGEGDPADRPAEMNPPPNGTVFRCVEIPPETTASREQLEEQMRSLFASLDAEHTRADTSRHPGMHRTRSIDYVVLLSGRLTLLLDEGEVELEPFDVVIQRGTNHAWVNPGPEPALVVSVLLDAEVPA